MGLASENGQILTAMADKFRQVNHLLGRVVSSEQRAASSEQRAASSEQRAASSEQRAESSEQRAVSSEQRAASSEQRAESSEFVIVDAGCGKAYLSLSLMYVLERMGRKVRLI
jgi:predicted lipid-binding transport protein (Tim44 family)